VYLERRVVERQRKWQTVLTWPQAALDLIFYAGLARYGIRPWRLACLSLVLLIFGTVFFTKPSTVLPKNVKTAVVSPIVLPWPVAFAVSLHEFLPIDIPMGSQWVPAYESTGFVLKRPTPKQTMWLSPATFATVFLRLPGWVLVPLGVASLAGLLRRVP
jgi:hypothetical protein